MGETKAVTNEHVVNIKHSVSSFEACTFVKYAPEAVAYIDTHTHSLSL